MAWPTVDGTLETRPCFDYSAGASISFSRTLASLVVFLLTSVSGTMLFDASS